MLIGVKMPITVNSQIQKMQEEFLECVQAAADYEQNPQNEILKKNLGEECIDLQTAAQTLLENLFTATEIRTLTDYVNSKNLNRGYINPNETIKSTIARCIKNFVKKFFVDAPDDNMLVRYMVADLMRIDAHVSAGNYSVAKEQAKKISNSAAIMLEQYDLCPDDREMYEYLFEMTTTCISLLVDMRGKTKC